MSTQYITLREQPELVQDELCNTMIAEIADQIYNDTVAKW